MQQTKKPDENNINTRQQLKQEISKHCCQHQSTCLIIQLLPLQSVRCHSYIALLSLLCRNAVASLSLSLPCYRSCCHYAVTPANASAVAQLSLSYCLCCRSAVSPLSLHCLSAVSLLSLRSRSAVAPLSLRSKRSKWLLRSLG